MKVIVGLGNPGSRYRRTPHNVGFEVVDELAARWRLSVRRSFRFAARLGKGVVQGQELRLVQPVAYMNASGPVVAAILRKLGAGVSDMIVILDDADLPLGQLRIRARGSAGGHKGLQSILTALGQTEEVVRVRLGVGRMAGGTDLVTQVLTPFSAPAWAVIRPAILAAADAVADILGRGVEAAMNQYNART